MRAERAFYSRVTANFENVLSCIFHVRRGNLNFSRVPTNLGLKIILGRPLLGAKCMQKVRCLNSSKIKKSKNPKSGVPKLGLFWPFWPFFGPFFGRIAMFGEIKRVPGTELESGGPVAHFAPNGRGFPKKNQFSIRFHAREIRKTPPPKSGVFWGPSKHTYWRRNRI